MELYSFLEKQCCRIGLRGKTRREVIQELATLACRSRHLDESRIEEVSAALEKRESQGSTGFGGGIAIPHARLDNMDDFVLAVGVHPDGVDFDALDRKRVRLFFVILGPEERVNDHLKLLAAVSRALTRTNAKKEILAAQGNEAVYEAFLRNAEGLVEGKKEKPKSRLLVLILFLEEYVYDVLELYLQRGIDGATVIDSFGMGEYISNVPIFATFIGFMQEKKNHSKTILAMVPEDMEAELVQSIEDLLGDLDKKQGAMLFSLDVSMYKGSMKML
ncbi:PTS sugar transporter subunit IIA [Salinispira pacifica]|uniref:PTS system, fructose-specific IIABC component n=1 Tax=Salinispira pacifica TaxID=1307761 RepID=V5WDC3_9SPIO|nr:PTS sugar transporter subunit IIA [Salinispira pacifica]AHC13544.1 PTS system, fructose-specific IIABC component [Salinispira pacifica]